MQHAMSRPKNRDADDFTAILPLYAASLMVTLAGVGAVGVTLTLNQWSPVWISLTLVGHAFSLAMRKLKVPAEAVFYPVMVIGTAITLKLAFEGSPLVGMDIGLGSLPPDMATATTIAAIAVLRTFTLLTNASLLFSPVPAITMLALVGSSNPNAEVPLFFGLMVLGSLFLSGYEAHLRRVARVGKRASPVLLHLLAAWCVTLVVAFAALGFPILIQPLLGPLSPFALPAVSKLNNLVNFTQPSSGQTPVGMGPINLSPIPIYEIYTAEGGKFRTDVYTRYTGRGWAGDRVPNVVDLHTEERVPDPVPDSGEDLGIRQNLFLFRFPGDPDLPSNVPTHEVRQRIVTKGFGSDGIPGLGRIVELRYPRGEVYLRADGTISGVGHLAPNRHLEVVSQVPDFPIERLKTAPPLDRANFSLPETLELPQSTLEVQEEARKITRGIDRPYDRIQAILQYIEKNCRYTLQEEVTPTGEDAAAYYLFHTKRGACDLAATAVAVMCRAVSIPTRVAVGYVAEEPLPGGDGFLIRQEHAHMWVECYLSGLGWVAFDPAPPIANIRDNVFDVAWSQFRTALSRVGGGGLDAVLLVGVILVTLLMAAYHGAIRLFAWARGWNRSRQIVHDSPGAALAGVYVRALRLLDRRGWRREGWMTSRELLEHLRPAWSHVPEAQRSWERLTELFEQAHYAGTADAAALKEAKALLAVLRRSVPRRRRAPVAETAPAPGAAPATATG